MTSLLLSPLVHFSTCLLNSERSGGEASASVDVNCVSARFSNVGMIRSNVGFVERVALVACDRHNQSW